MKLPDDPKRLARMMAEALDDPNTSSTKDLKKTLGRQLISDKLFSDFVKQHQKNAIKGIAKEHGKWDTFPPTIAVLTRNEDKTEHHVVLMGLDPNDMPDTADERADMMYALGMRFDKEFDGTTRPIAVAFSFEAWMARLPQDAPEEDKHLAPSEMAGRVEQVCIIGGTIDGRTALLSCDIERDEDGRLEKLIADTDLAGENIGEDVTDNPLIKGFFAGYAESNLPSDIKETLTKVAKTVADKRKRGK